jgi:hypothetical protein
MSSPYLSCCHSMGLDATDLWDQELFVHWYRYKFLVLSRPWAAQVWRNYAGSRSTDPSPARIGKTYDHKNLQECGIKETELLVETEILSNKREDTQGLLVHVCCFLVCRLAPILLHLLSKLTVYIRFGLECISSVYQQVFSHCLPLILHWKIFFQWLEIFCTELKPIKTICQIKINTSDLGLIFSDSEWIFLRENSLCMQENSLSIWGNGFNLADGFN